MGNDSTSNDYGAWLQEAIDYNAEWRRSHATSGSKLELENTLKEATASLQKLILQYPLQTRFLYITGYMEGYTSIIKENGGQFADIPDAKIQDVEFIQQEMTTLAKQMGLPDGRGIQIRHMDTVSQQNELKKLYPHLNPEQLEEGVRSLRALAEIENQLRVIKQTEQTLAKSE